MDDTIGPDQELTAAVDEVLAEHGSAAGTEDDVDNFETIWSGVARLGFTLVGVAEEYGGSGGTLRDTLTVVRSIAQHAIPLPLAETALAGWLLSRAGASVPEHPLSIAPGLHPDDEFRLSEGKASGVLHDVPWGSRVGGVVALALHNQGTELVVIDPKRCEVKRGSDLAGQSRDALTLDEVPVEILTSTVDFDEFHWRAALLRAAQITGALAAVDGLTRRYTGERVQFGKPIAAFQAVQQHIVTIAQAAELTAMSLWRACWAAEVASGSFEVCAAKLVANESARVAIRASHQAHGAIGMTREYPLHRFTRRLNVWRHEFGTEAQLAAHLGAAVSQAPSLARCIFHQVNEIEVSCRI